jgi:SCY1-like protein 2
MLFRLSIQVPQYILPLVYRALESAPEIQQLAVNVIPTFMNTIEYSAMKNNVIPRIQVLRHHFVPDTLS